MTLLGAVVLLVLVGLTMLGAPWLLRPRGWLLCRPRLALAGWVGTVAGGCVALLGSLVLTGAAAAGSGSAPGTVATVGVVSTWCGLAALGGLSSLVATRYEPLAGSARRTAWQLTLLEARHGASSDTVGGLPLIVLPVDEPVAFGSVTVLGPRVVLSRGLLTRLAADEMRAVVEHERAHLSGRHRLLLRFALMHRICFPALGSARRFDGSVRVFVELVADDAAVRRCGSDCVARALEKMGSLTDDPTLVIRAQRVKELGSRTRNRAAAASWARRGWRTSPSPRPR